MIYRVLMTHSYHSTIVNDLQQTIAGGGNAVNRVEWGNDERSHACTTRSVVRAYFSAEPHARVHRPSGRKQSDENIRTRAFCYTAIHAFKHITSQTH
jgi:hypothetical protein